MSSRLHPAKQLFRELFRAAAAVDSPHLPTYFVPRHWFHGECRKRGIECPANFVAATEWEKSIGLQRFVAREIAAWKRRRLP